jgi:hypothetical protein
MAYDAELRALRFIDASLQALYLNRDFVAFRVRVEGERIFLRPPGGIGISILCGYTSSIPFGVNSPLRCVIAVCSSAKTVADGQ